MSYSAQTFTGGEQPTTVKWNLLWSNDASFNDGTGISGGAIGFTQLASNVIPTGQINAYGGTSAPTNWLLCDGGGVSRSVYAPLFAILSTAYGAGDGSTTFNVPDFRGRTPFGKNSATFSVLGSTGGVESQNLTHSHTVNNHSHPQNTYATGINNSNHTHSGIVRGVAASDGMSADHTHNYQLTDGGSAPGTSNSLGATGVLPPYQVVNFIIKN